MRAKLLCRGILHAMQQAATGNFLFCCLPTVCKLWIDGCGISTPPGPGGPVYTCRHTSKVLLGPHPWLGMEPGPGIRGKPGCRTAWPGGMSRERCKVGTHPRTRSPEPAPSARHVAYMEPARVLERLGVGEEAGRTAAGVRDRKEKKKKRGGARERGNRIYVFIDQTESCVTDISGLIALYPGPSHQKVVVRGGGGSIICLCSTWSATLIGV